MAKKRKSFENTEEKSLLFEPKDQFFSVCFCLFFLSSICVFIPLGFGLTVFFWRS